MKFVFCVEQEPSGFVISHLFPVFSADKGEPPIPQTEDGFLNFTQVTRNHTGWYKCISHHPMGKFSSVGYYLNVRCKWL